MTIATKYTVVIRGIKQPLIVFLVLFITSMILAKFLGAEGLLTSTVPDNNTADTYKMFSHYSLMTVIATIGFILYISFTSIGTFFKAVFEPKIAYGDVFLTKHLDIPVIPNQENVYKFMRQADKIHNKGAEHFSADVLDYWNVDQFGNRLR